MEELATLMLATNEVKQFALIMVVFGFIWTNAKMAETFLREEFMANLGLRLYGSASKSTLFELKGDILTIVNSLLGSDDGSLPKFSRTACLSIIGIFFTLIAMLLVTDLGASISATLSVQNDEFSYIFRRQVILNFLPTFTVLALLNLLVDYISFTKSVILAERFLSRSGASASIGYFSADLALTAFVALLSAALLLTMTSIGTTFDPLVAVSIDQFEAVQRVFYYSLTPLFFSTFSILVVLISFSTVLVAVHLAWQLDTVRRLLPKYLKTEKHPIQIAVAIGNCIALLIFFLYVVISRTLG